MPAFGLCGLGNVGSGVMRLLQKNGSRISSRWGIDLQPKHILVRDLHKPRSVEVPPGMLTTDPATIIDDPDVSVVVELIGGRSTAREIVLESLRRGKAVVTANKDLLAYDGREILATAAAHGTEVFFEASVAAGTPVIRPLHSSLASDHITTIRGILNGTTNYILTRMTHDGCDYATALAEAQANGFAEKDPLDDVDGRDAMRKLAVLCLVAFGTAVDPEEIYMEGISRVDKRDIEYAHALGYVIKLVATGRDHGGAVELRVHPTLLPAGHPLARVDGSFNSIMVEGDFVGPLTFMGRGAGGNATATAVVADILEAVHHREKGVASLRLKEYRRVPVVPIDEVAVPYYVRFTARDHPGVLGQIAEAFGRHGVNLRSVIQKPAPQSDDGQAELVFLTGATQDKHIQAALAELMQHPELCQIANVIRVDTEV